MSKKLRMRRKQAEADAAQVGGVLRQVLEVSQSVEDGREGEKFS